MSDQGLRAEGKGKNGISYWAELKRAADTAPGGKNKYDLKPNSSFPRTRESRFAPSRIRLDTRFRGYDGTRVVSLFCGAFPHIFLAGYKDHEEGI